MIKLREHAYHLLSLEDNGDKPKEIMRRTSQVVDLADYREKTAEQRRYEQEDYYIMIDRLPIKRLSYEGQLLIIQYDGSKNPEIINRINENPAWGLTFFGAISKIHLDGLIIKVNVPDKIGFMNKKGEGHGREIIVVAFLTRTNNPGEMIVWDEEEIEQRRRPSYTFR